MVANAFSGVIWASLSFGSYRSIFVIISADRDFSYFINTVFFLTAYNVRPCSGTRYFISSKQIPRAYISTACTSYRKFSPSFSKSILISGGTKGDRTKIGNLVFYLWLKSWGKAKACWKLHSL